MYKQVVSFASSWNGNNNSNDDNNTHKRLYTEIFVVMTTCCTSTEMMRSKNCILPNMLFYGIPGIIFLITGLGFVGWTLQLYAVSQEIVTNVSLIGIGCVVLGAVLLMTAVILFSIVTVVGEKK